MKRIRLTRSGRMPFIGMIALALTAVTVLSLPLSMARYATTGTGTAQARVARWDVDLTVGVERNNQYGFSFSNIPTASDERAQITFTVKNDSEVAAAFIPRIRYITTPHSEANVTSSSDELQGVSFSCSLATPTSGESGTAFIIPPNTPMAEFTALLPPGTQYGNATLRCRLFIDAVQVD